MEMDASKKHQGMCVVIRKKLAPYGLMLAAAAFAGQTQATTMDIVSLDMASTSIEIEYT